VLSLMRRRSRSRRLRAAVVILCAMTVGVAALRHDGDAGVPPVDAFQRALDADPQHQSALRVRRVTVPDLVGQPVGAAEAFVATVPNARLSVGGEGPVILFQQPPA
jgi:hypothetical protein